MATALAGKNMLTSYLR